MIEHFKWNPRRTRRCGCHHPVLSYAIYGLSLGLGNPMAEALARAFRSNPKSAMTCATRCTPLKIKTCSNSARCAANGSTTLTLTGQHLPSHGLRNRQHLKPRILKWRHSRRFELNHEPHPPEMAGFLFFKPNGSQRIL